MKLPNRKLISAAVALALAAGTAHAALERVGPIDKSSTGGGYPAWFQDKNGLVLDFCSVRTAAEDAGVCFVNAPNGPPEAFPNNFSDEHFYWASEAALTTNGVTQPAKALLVLALEGAFVNGDVVQGDQMVFGRIRMKITELPSDGDYKIIHPFGEKEFKGMKAGERIFFTDDVGINCPATFECALDTSIGPFLIPVSIIDPVSGRIDPTKLVDIEGTKYISDALAPVQVTGSPITSNGRAQNFFRIEGPNIGGPGVNAVETDLFTVLGRAHMAPIPSRMSVDRASYSHKPGQVKVDVFAASSKPLAMATSANPPADPSLSFGPVAVDPALPIPPHMEYLMQGDTHGHFHGQAMLVNIDKVPAEITVFNNSDTPASYRTQNLVDEVTVSAADYNPSDKTLTIVAASSDEVDRPQLSASLGLYVSGKDEDYSLGGGMQTFSGITVPPAEVTVKSAKGGRTTVPVRTVFVSGGNAQAQDDGGTVAEDGMVEIDIGANDVAGIFSTAAIVAAPAHGTAQLVVANNPDGTERLLARYSPAPNYSGPDSFSYAYDPAHNGSNVAQVRISVTPEADPPMAAADSAFAVATKAVLIDVAANDSDPDGDLDPLSAVPVGAATVYGSVARDGTGKLRYTGGPLPLGATSVTDTFQYTIADKAGHVSAPATVTVALYANETLQTVKAVYTKAQKTGGTTTTKWVVSGSSNILGTQTVDVYLGANPNDPTSKYIGSSPVATDGTWTIQLLGSSVSGDSGCKCVSAKSSLGGVTTTSFPVKIQ